MSLRNIGPKRMTTPVGTPESESRAAKPIAMSSSKLERPHRRLVLMFDGTGNKRLNLSNVARMFEAIDDSKPGDYKPSEKNPLDYSQSVLCVKCRESMREPGPLDPTYEADSKFATGRPCGTCGQLVLEPAWQPQQLVKYIKGVGTGFFGLERLFGQGFGYGLSESIQEGYVWLSNNYRVGDEIFVFGFSRGAFAARSLVSLVHKCGILKKVSSKSTEDHRNDVWKEHNRLLEKEEEIRTCDQIVKDAYALYRAYVHSTDLKGGDLKETFLYADYCDRLAAFRNNYIEREKRVIQEAPVKMLGVWDTVGALGSKLSGTKYQFHNQGLSCIVQNAYHALAIDEHRKHFAPTLWDQVTPKNQEVKQVWFVGSHCNVGGGADMDDLDDPDDLWQYSYVWMQKHAQNHGLRFYWTYNSPATQTLDGVPSRRVSTRKPEDSFSLFLSGLYRIFFCRYHRQVESSKLGAKLHWSVQERININGLPEDPPSAGFWLGLWHLLTFQWFMVSPEQSPRLYRPHSLFGGGQEGFWATLWARILTRRREIPVHPCPSAPGFQDPAQDVSKKVLRPWLIESDDGGPCKSLENFRAPCSCTNQEVQQEHGSNLWISKVVIAKTPWNTMCVRITALLPWGLRFLMKHARVQK